MILFILIAVANIALSSMLFPGTCRFTLKPYLKFLGLMAIVTAIRFVVYKIAVPMPTNSDSIITMRSIHPLQFLMVFWEDAFFTLPTIIMEKMGASKLFRNCMLILSSLAFASGHIAYGLPWAFITLFYVPMISYKYGKKHGLSTVMACHITYDMVTWLTMIQLIKG
jgi:membrane protease YdiL (CAAX protease family)